MEYSSLGSKDSLFGQPSVMHGKSCPIETTTWKHAIVPYTTSCVPLQGRTYSDVCRKRCLGHLLQSASLPSNPHEGCLTSESKPPGLFLLKRDSITVKVIHKILHNHGVVPACGQGPVGILNLRTTCSAALSSSSA